MANRELQDWLAEYMKYTYDSEAPDNFHLWTGVYTISCVLKRKCYIDQVHFKWYPNFYIIFVAPPGIATKSTCIRMGEDLIAALGTITIGPDSLTWQSLVGVLERSLELHMMPDGSMLNTCPVAFFSSELQSLMDLDDSKMLTILTDLWDGKDRPWVRDTKTSGTNAVVNPYVNILACITPAGLADLPQRTLRGGFASRTLWVEGHEKRKLIPYPSAVIQSVAHQKRRDKLLKDLEKIAQLKGEYKLIPSAVKWGEKWYGELYKRYRDCETEEQQGPLARRQTQVHKLAMILSAARSDNMEITEHHLQIADTMLNQLSQSSTKTIQIVTSANGQDRAYQVLEMVQRHGRIVRTELYQKFLSKMSWKEFEEVLISLHHAGHIREVAGANTIIIEAASVAP